MKIQLRLGGLMVALLTFIGINAQTILNTTAVSGFANNNGSGIVTFNFQNSNSYDIIITDIEGITGTSGVNTAELYYKTTPVSGTPGAISSANGWTLAASQSFTGVSNTSGLNTQVFMSNISVIIPANTTYGMVVFAPGQRYHTMVSPNIPLTTVSAGGCSILMGTNISYGGGTPPAGPTFTPRGWMGKITFIPALPCVNPPTGGFAATNKSITCSGESFELSLSGSSGGTGQTYQWQSSPDSLVWTDIVGATTPNYLASQSTTTYYRCGLTCTSTVYSAGVKVTTSATALPGGTYTINGNLVTGGTNFNSFADFRQAIVCGGIAGPVVVNVIGKGTPYNEQFQLGVIGGSSSTNTITINGNGEMITNGGGGAYRGTVTLDGTSYVTFNNLSIEGSGTTNCFAVQLLNDAQNITFDSCTIAINPTATSSLTAAFVAGGSLTSATTASLGARNLTVTNCDISGGYYCFTLTGPTSAPFSSGNYIANNTMRDFYLYGIYCTYQDSTTIRGNDINRSQRQGTITTFYGAYFLGNMTDVIVDGNKIHNPGDQNPTATFTSYPLFLSSANASQADPMYVVNNAIYNINSNGLTYGLYLSSGNFINFYHNTVSIDNAFATSTSAQRALSCLATSGTFEFKNNLFSISHGGTGTKNVVYFSSTVPTFSINYNQYNISSTGGSNNTSYWSGANLATFADWQAANSGAFEVNGKYGDPIFDSTAFGPQSSVGNSAGDNLSAIVATDIYGVARGTSPDIGAVEFTPLSCLQPSIIGASATPFSVDLNWLVGSGVDSVSIEYGPSGFTQGTGLQIYTSDTTYSFTGLFDQTCYDFYLTSWCSGQPGVSYTLYTVCTPCGPQSMPFSESFNAWPPGCFELTNTTGWDWDQDPAGYARARFWSYSTGIAYMTSGPINITQAAQVKFKWAHLYSASYPDDRLILRARIVGSSNWDTLVDLVGPTFNSPNSGNTTPPANASDFIDWLGYLDTSYVGNAAEFQFVALTDFGPHAYVDDFVVEGVPNCTTPFNLGASSITSSGAALNWSTVNGTCFNIEYGPAGFIQGTGLGTTVNNVTSPYSLTGLNANTSYDFYVSDCCNGVWVGPFTFKTLCTSQLNGTYTVGGTPGATNFATLDSAMNVLTGCGISGPVVFNLQGGTFLIPGQQVGSITGVNATNTVTFKGGGFSTDTIKITGGTAGFDFDGGGHFIFEDLTVDGGASGRTIWLHNGASNISFDNCHLLNTPSATGSTTGVIVASATSTSNFSYGDNANNISVTNSKLVGGYCGAIFNGTSTSNYSSNITIEDCEFEDVYYYALRFYYMSDISIKGNSITGASPIYGMYSYYWNNIAIERNYLIGTTSALYSGYVNIYRTDTPAVRSTIKNNFMIGGTTYGNYNYAARHLDYTHNSVYNSGTYGAYFSATTSAGLTSFDVKMYNNIFVSASNYALYCFATNFPGIMADNNIYYTNGTSLAYWNAARADLAALKAGDLNNNQNSLSGDPGYISNTDLHIIGTLPNDVGANGYATDDIDGDTRPATGSTTVDIGADEYTPLQFDAAMNALLVPTAGCGDSATEVHVVVTNFGLNSITSLPVTVMVSGGVTATLNNTLTSGIAPGATDTILVGTINTYAGVTGVNFMGYTQLANDQNTSNDTLSVGPGAYTPYEPQYYPEDTVCANADSATFAAVTVPGAMYGWYATATDTVPVAMGDSFTFAVSGQNTWYLAYLSNADSLLTTFAAGNGQNGNMFDLVVKNTVTITGFTINNSTAGAVEVYYKSGSYVGSENSAANWTNLTPTPITIATTAGPTYFDLPASITLASGQTHAFYVTMSTGSMSYTNGGTIGNVYASNSDLDFLEGIGKSYPFGSTFSPRIWNGIIHYGSIGCSDTRQVLTLNLNADSAVADYSFAVQANGADVNFDASASIGNTYTWDFGDGNSGSGVTTSHTYANGGTYTVCLVVTEPDCGTTDTICKNVLVTVGIEESLINQTLSIYPNPTNGAFRVEFQVEGLQDVELRIVSLLGQVMYESKPGNISGLYREEIDLKDEAAGVYILQVITDDGAISKRITLRK